ncbi:MAG: peptidase E [Oscillospiraceae bacterium]|nr:peptidase E [Oscillospiraceae bacterium]
MKKMILSSAGFETQAIRNAFLEFVGKNPQEIHALWIPTAANSPAAIAVLPGCMNDLLDIGIPAENIKIFDLHRAMTFEELSAFDAVYFTGGSPQYLLERINDTGFCKPLCEFAENGGVYVGVSAGSIVAAGNLPNNLGYLKATLNVHLESGTVPGVFDNVLVSQIDLTDKTAVVIHGDLYEII